MNDKRIILAIIAMAAVFIAVFAFMLFFFVQAGLFASFRHFLVPVCYCQFRANSPRTG